MVNKLFDLFYKKVTPPVYVFILILLLLYLSWEIYWFTQVGYPFIKWHTHLMVFVYIELFGMLIFRSLGSINKSGRADNFFILFSTILLSLFAAEASLCATGLTKTYIEQISGSYMSPYDPLDKSFYHLWKTGKPHWLTKPEYSYWRPTNSLGFGDVEWVAYKRLKEKRILSLGDSFTEGDGAPFDSSYVSLLRTHLRILPDTFYVMNGGVCGSDPYNNYIIFQDKLQEYKPDIIIQSLGSGDMIADIIVRGGMERFRPDGTVRYHSPPWWEPLYAISFTSRLLFRWKGYTEWLRKGPPTLQEKQRMEEGMKDLFARYSSLCSKNNIRLEVVLHPELKEVESNKYDFDFAKILKYASDFHITVIDLLPLYREYIDQSHTHPSDYFWHYDGHHNSKGYEMMAATIFESSMPLFSDSLPYPTANK